MCRWSGGFASESRSESSRFGGGERFQPAIRCQKERNALGPGGGISGRGVVHVPHILGVQRLHGSFSIECQTAFDWMPWEYVPPTRASVFASRTSHARATPGCKIHGSYPLVSSMDFCHSSLPSTDPSFTEDWWQCVRYAEKRLTQIKHPIQHFERSMPEQLWRSLTSLKLAELGSDPWPRCWPPRVQNFR
jgi:hypothetical protein